jgi:tRNA(Ile)-lysidine synthase
MRQLTEAGDDKLPCVRWPGAELRRYRDLVYAQAPVQLPMSDWQYTWNGTPLPLPAGIGSLALVEASGQCTALANGAILKVRFRKGGESLRLAAGGYRRDLRDLFQECGIPPWERGRIPIIFDGEGELLAVGDLWLSDAGRSVFAQYARRLQWIPALTAR